MPEGEESFGTEVTMLAVTLNELRFEYDIHSLVKAFYPAEMVKVFKEGTKDLASDGDNPEISVDF